MGRPRLNKEVQSVIALAEENGYVWDGKIGRHVKMLHKTNGTIIIIPTTPSAPTWKKNLTSEIKRQARKEP
jgi:predicted RNA binding protein YcfA (HicA-like mRNA interferase family)